MLLISSLIDSDNKINNSQDIFKISYMFGYDYFGPFLLGFTKWIDEMIKRNKINKVFFFARDGYMMKKSYEIYTDKSYACYAYFSRNSIRQALLYRCKTFSDSLRYITKERYISFYKLLKYYGFTSDECNLISKKYNIELNVEFEYEKLFKTAALEKLYRENLDIINFRSKDKADLLRNYLNQINFKGKCMIVDIGWHGSMQFYLEKFLQYENIQASIIGLYIGINPVEKLNGDVFGYVYGPDNQKMRKKILCFLGGYEKLFQSSEGSTDGYRMQKGEVFPVLAHYEYEYDSRVRSIINQWQKGALNYIEVHKFDKDNMQDLYVKPLISFGINPPKWGLKLFEDFYLEDGEKQYFLPQKKLHEYKIKELFHSLSNSVWKIGFMKSLFKIPFPYYLIYCMLRK